MRLNEILDVYQRGDFIALSLKERRAVVREVSKRYKKAKKKGGFKYQKILHSMGSA